MLLAAWRVLVGLKYSHQQHFNDPSFEETYAPLKLNHLTGSAPNTLTQILLRFRFLPSPLGPLAIPKVATEGTKYSRQRCANISAGPPRFNIHKLIYT